MSRGVGVRKRPDIQRGSGRGNRTTGEIRKSYCGGFARTAKMIVKHREQHAAIKNHMTYSGQSQSAGAV